MATYTSKYHLEKPDQTDIYNIDVHNANSDAIDAALAAKPDSSNLATVESTNKASRAYTVGEYLVYNGLLYRVSAAIASGGTLTPGSNITATTTGAQLKSLNDSLNIRSFNLSYNGVTFGFRTTGKILSCQVAHASTIALPTNWTTLGAYPSGMDTFTFLAISTVSNETITLRYSNGNVQLMCNTASAIYPQGSGSTMLNG